MDDTLYQKALRMWAKEELRKTWFSCVKSRNVCFCREKDEELVALVSVGVIGIYQTRYDMKLNHYRCHSRNKRALLKTADGDWIATLEWSTTQRDRVSQIYKALNRKDKEKEITEAANQWAEQTADALFEM